MDVVRRVAGWPCVAMCCGLALAGCGGGGEAGAGLAPTINIFPTSAVVAPGAAVQFRTVLENWNGGVTWEIAEPAGGTISADGAYTAPGAAGRYTVVARSVIDGAITGHAVVVVGGAAGDFDGSFNFAASPMQPGVLIMTPATGCLRGTLLNREGQALTGVPIHLYRLTDTAGRAWENGAQLDLDLPVDESGNLTRQTLGNSLQAHRATTISTSRGFYQEPASNYVFGSTPAGYYLLTHELALPDGSVVEVFGAISRVFIGAEAIVSVFADQSPTLDSAELQPGQTRPLANPAFPHFVGKLAGRELTEVAGAGTFAAGAFTAGNVLGVYTVATVGVIFPTTVFGTAAVHVVGVQARFDRAQTDFDGGPVTLSVAAVDGLTNQTPTPVPVTAVVTGPDGFSQTVTLTPVAQAATSFGANEFAFPEDWQFFTGPVTLPANLTDAQRTYTAAVTATYTIAGPANTTATVAVPGLNQPANPPNVRAR